MSRPRTLLISIVAIDRHTGCAPYHAGRFGSAEWIERDNFILRKINTKGEGTAQNIPVR